MKMMTLVSFWMCLLMTACNSGEAPSTKPSATNSKEQAPAASTQGEPKASASYMNGTNDQNKGDKTGTVHLHGTINFPGGGDVTLYETEAKTRSKSQPHVWTTKHLILEISK